MSAVMSGVFRIGRNAEVRHTAGGTPVTTLSLAYDYGNKDQDGKRPTQWIEAGLWNERAVSLSEHLIQGRRIWCVLDDVHIAQFNKRDGTPGHKMAARIGNLHILFEGQQTGAPQGRDQQAPPAREPRPQRAPAPARDAELDDDIPF